MNLSWRIKHYWIIFSSDRSVITENVLSSRALWFSLVFIFKLNMTSVSVNKISADYTYHTHTHMHAPIIFRCVYVLLVKGPYLLTHSFRLSFGEQHTCKWRKNFHVLYFTYMSVNGVREKGWPIGLFLFILFFSLYLFLSLVRSYWYPNKYFELTHNKPFASGLMR